MQKIAVAGIIRFIRATDAIRAETKDAPDVDEVVQNKTRTIFRKAFKRMALQAENLSTPTTLRHAERMHKRLKDPNCTYREVVQGLTELSQRFEDELLDASIVSLNGDYSELAFETKPYFGSDVDTQFPDAAHEISEASQCLAFQRYGGATFHLMRVLEIQLKAMYLCLGLVPMSANSNRNWGGILTQIRNEINRKGTAGWLQSGDKNTFDDFYASLDAVRSAWRNPTMHVDRVYSEQEVKVIYEAVRLISQKLSARFDQAGSPLA